MRQIRFNPSSHACAVLVALSVGSGPARAAADDTWLVIDVQVAGTEQVTSAQRVANTLREQGKDVLSDAAAGARYERAQSRSAVRPTDAEARALDDLQRELARALALDDYRRAQPLLQRLASTSSDTLDAFHREPARARRGFDICLLAAYLESKHGSEESGFRRVGECQAAFPGFQPQQGRFLPQTLRNFLDRAAGRLAAPAVTLRVDADGVSAQACRVRLNGIEHGALPMTARALRDGATRVQIECGDRIGRIHEVPLREGSNQVVIDLSLDAAVDSHDGLSLRYENEGHAQDEMLRHAAQLAEATQAAHVIQVAGSELVRTDLSKPRRVMRARIGEGGLELAIQRLLKGGEPTANVLASASHSDEPSRAPYRVLAWSSVAGAALGVTTAIIGWRVHEDAIADHNESSPCTLGEPQAKAACASLRDRASSAKTAIVIGAVAGGTFAALSALFFVLDADADSSAEELGSRACGSGPGTLGIECRLRF